MKEHLFLIIFIRKFTCRQRTHNEICMHTVKIFQLNNIQWTLYYIIELILDSEKMYYIIHLIFFHQKKSEGLLKITWASLILYVLKYHLQISISCCHYLLLNTSLLCCWWLMSKQLTASRNSAKKYILYSKNIYINTTSIRTNNPRISKGEIFLLPSIYRRRLIFTLNFSRRVFHCRKFSSFD